MFRRAGIISLALLLLSTGSVSAAVPKVTMTSYAFTPATRTIKVGKPLKWKNTSTRRHTATPTNYWSWGGVDVAAGTASALVTPTQSGTYPYFCSIHPTKMKGTLAVAMIVTPAGGNTGTPFLLTLGTVVSPGVSVHDVEVRRDGGAWVGKATTSQPTASLLFQQTGTWDIRSRLRWQLGGQTTDWSPISTVIVF